MNIVHNVTIDLLAPRKNVLHLVQEDSARSIRLTLMSGGALFDVAADLSESETLLKFVEFRKADGHGGMYDTTSDGREAVVATSAANVWLVNLDGACFAVPGWTQINVRFETEAGRRLHVFRTMVDVEPTASSDTEPSEQPGINSIGDLKAAVTAMFEETMSVEAKQALLNLLAHVAYTDEHGQDYYDELEAELFRTAEIVSISAVFDQGENVIYDNDDLDTLRQYLTVTATYEDLSTREVTGYTLSGTLTEGTSTITVSYGGKTATFDVTVTEYNAFEHATYERYPWARTSYSAETADYIYKNSTTAARARIALPLANPNKTFTVTDATKYNIVVYNVTSLTTEELQVSGTTVTAWPGTDNNKSWGTSGSSSAPYVALSFKKLDNTEFTDEELANMYGTVFTMS